jgi:subtilisin family serine protease
LPSDTSIVTGESIGIADWDSDSFGHGTHVAGTIAALNNDGTGVVGVHSNNSLKLHIINVFGANEFAYGFDIVNAAFRCAYAGAYVISMSLGGEGESKFEAMAYEEIYKYDILIIAAAGNGGNSVKNSPASYSSVVSVAAIDANRIVAPFSTFNNDVEISGPGVNVLSTVPMGTGVLNSLVVGSTTYVTGISYGSPFLSSSAPLANFGIGDKEDDAVSGKVCLIARGQIYFSEKVLNCQNSGGVAAILYNNVAGGFSADVIGAGTTIPSLTVSDTDGATLLKQLGQTATVTVSDGNDYEYKDGTSMATPHVSAVAALVWARNPKCTAAQLRNSLAKSARDLGAKGRDKYYGYGLVQAKAADDRIKKRGCGK